MDFHFAADVGRPRGAHPPALQRASARLGQRYPDSATTLRHDSDGMPTATTARRPDSDGATATTEAPNNGGGATEL